MYRFVIEGHTSPPRIELERENATLRTENARLRKALANLLHVVETDAGALASVDAVLAAKSALAPTPSPESR